jgi:16S rRNA (guanine527-N7)-methyltransferase
LFHVKTALVNSIKTDIYNAPPTVTPNALLLRTLALKNHLAVTDEQLSLLDRFATCLREWNAKINLVSRRDEENLFERHIVGSIALLFMRPLAGDRSLIDIGTGGGFPGVPLAILRPDVSVTLVDSIQKKMTALEAIVRELGLTNARVVAGRAEELGRKKEFARQFDYVIARAVGAARELVTWSKPFLRPPGEPLEGAIVQPGSIILLKGGDLTGELAQMALRHHPAAVETLPVHFQGSESFDLADKKIIIIQP